MISRVYQLFFFLFFVLPLFAGASVLPRTDGNGGINNSCNTGPVQCCSSVQSANSKDVTLLFALLGLSISLSSTDQVGINCSPITVIGLAGNSCSSQPVCCANNQYNGLVNIGCTPININA